MKYSTCDLELNFPRAQEPISAGVVKPTGPILGVGGQLEESGEKAGRVKRTEAEKMADLLRSSQSSDVEDDGLLAGVLRKSRSLGSSREMLQTSKEALHSVVHSWASKRFMSGFAILFPIAVTIYATWWFLAFFDAFFSPVYQKILGFKLFGLGFITSMAVIFLTGVFMSSWVGGLMLQLGEWVIRRLPLVKHIYSASKQVSIALNPDNADTKAFKECVIIKHPRTGEWAIGFITGESWIQCPAGDLHLYTIYIPTNHVYVGDVLLLNSKDILRPNLSVSEGLEIVISCGMAIPDHLTATIDNS